MKQTNIDHSIKADVLIIGGGFAGLWAAVSAKEHVENVVVVDKGPADWGGLGTASGGDFQCVQDTTVEAALDDVNVARYAQYVRRMTKNTQFILITHRRGTMEEADVLYGVTMQEEGVSKILELKTAEMAKKLGLA